MTHLIVMIVRKKTRPYDFTVTIVSKYCFVTVVIKLDISYKYNYFPNLSFCQIFSNKCGVNSSWMRRRAGDPCGLSLE